MQTLYLVRHTAPRIAPGVCYGQLDVDVADTFGAEAAAVLEWLSPVELVITSPLLRSRNLGKYLAQVQRCPLRADARLVEMHFGTWEGRTWHDIPRRELDAWSADILNYAPPEGESAAQMMRRVQNVLEDIASLPQTDIAVVTHGGVIRCVLALLGAIPLPRTLAWQIDFGAAVGVRLPTP